MSNSTKKNKTKFPAQSKSPKKAQKQHIQIIVNLLFKRKKKKKQIVDVENRKKI